MRTNLGCAFHLQHLNTFDDGGAGVVDAVEHRLLGFVSYC